MGRHDVMLVVIDPNLQWTDTERKRLGCRLAGVLISDFLPWLPSHIRNHMENQLFLPCNIQIDNENTSHLVFSYLFYGLFVARFRDGCKT